MVGFRQDRCVGIRVSEDVHVASCEDVSVVEPVPVLVASWEIVGVTHVWPSVVVEVDIESGWVVNLDPSVRAASYSVLGDEEVALGVLAHTVVAVLSVSVVVRSCRVCTGTYWRFTRTAVGVASEVTEVVGCVDVPFADACCETACGEYGGAIFTGQVFS